MANQPAWRPFNDFERRIMRGGIYRPCAAYAYIRWLGSRGSYCRKEWIRGGFGHPDSAPLLLSERYFDIAETDDGLLFSADDYEKIEKEDKSLIRCRQIVQIKIWYETEGNGEDNE